MKTIIMNTESSKTNEPNKVAFNLLQKLDLRSSNKHVVIQNLSLYYYTWKNIRQQPKNNKLKIVAPMWNDEFELPDGLYSVSDIQDYIEYIIKKYKTLPAIILFISTSTGLIINECSKLINRYKLKLQTPETMKLFGSTKKIIDKTKNWENIPSLKGVEVVLFHCNLVDNQN